MRGPCRWGTCSGAEHSEEGIFQGFCWPPFFFPVKYKDVQFFWFQFSIGEFYNLVIKISDRL